MHGPRIAQGRRRTYMRDLMRKRRVCFHLHMSVGYPTSAVMIIVAETRGEAKAMMIALVLELCGGVCALSTIVFLALASVSKSMPDLERDETATNA